MNPNILSKRTVGKSGLARGGEPFTRGALYNLLGNVLYLGEIAHRGHRYPGQHEAIVEREVFEEAQSILAQNRGERRRGQGAREPSLLTGLLFDHAGHRLTPSHSSRGPRRFRYYVGPRSLDGAKRQLRVPAGEMERIVLARLSQWLLDRHSVVAAFTDTEPDALAIEAVLMTASACATELGRSSPAHLRELLLALVTRIAVGDGRIAIDANPAALLDRAGLTINRPVAGLSLECEFQLVRRSKEVRLTVAPRLSASQPQADPALVKLLVKAHAARQALLASGGRSLTEVSEAEGHEPHYFAVLVKLSYLAPDITEAIIEGRQPARLNRQQLARMRQWPMDWTEQRALIGGFAAL